MSDQHREGNPPKIDGPDAEKRQGDDEAVAGRLPGHTPQGRTGDAKEDVAEETPGFTPQGRSNS